MTSRAMNEALGPRDMMASASKCHNLGCLKYDPASATMPCRGRGYPRKEVCELAVVAYQRLQLEDDGNLNLGSSGPQLKSDVDIELV
jgi:hypothetical protein